MAMALTVPYPVRQPRTAVVYDDDPDLIAKACRGDLKAYRECVDRFSPRVYTIAYQMVGNAADAQDIAQEVFIRLHRSLDRYQPTARFTTWLYRLTVNLAIDYQRRHARHRHRSADDSPEAQAVADPGPGPDEAMSASEFHGAIRKLAERLTPKQRSVFVLRDLQGFTTEEIAAILKCRQSTVRVHLAQARAQIKDALLRHFPELCGGFKS
jgi:RNA polymerase sigma-70 factor (ECF subfamily)